MVALLLAQIALLAFDGAVDVSDLLLRREVYRNDYRDFQDARASIGEFLELVAIEGGRHSALGYLAPAEFEEGASS